MLNELKRFLSFRILTALLIVAVSIYLMEIASKYLREFSDIILIVVFGWILSFILEPFVDKLTGIFKIPKVLATGIIFLLFAGIIVATVYLIVPVFIYQINSLARILPNFIETAPPAIRAASEALLRSISSLTDYTNLIPPIAQFFFNLTTILILSFYITVEKDSINEEIMNISPKSWHENIKFVQRVIDQTFASFLRVQVIWGLIGGITTWIVLAVFGVEFAVSTAIIAGVLSAVPIIGPLIGLVPPIVVTFINNPASALLIIVILAIIQQFIYNFLGTKIIAGAFKINPIMVIIALLLGFKVAGVIGGLFAVPLASIVIVVGREFYNHYVKHVG